MNKYLAEATGTFALVFVEQVPSLSTRPYIISQAAGAFIASLTLHYLFPANLMLGSTLPAGTALQSFI